MQMARAAADSKDMVSQEDGRLSEKEFARVILLSSSAHAKSSCRIFHVMSLGRSDSQGGVNWLGMDEIQFLFSSMDKDKSGKLNLGDFPRFES